MGEQDVDTYDRDCDRHDDYNDGDQWTQEELDEMRDIEKMHESGEVYKTYEKVCPENNTQNYTKGEKTGWKLGSENQPNFKCDCGNWNYEEPCHTSGEVNGELRTPCGKYENQHRFDRSLHSDAFWLINEPARMAEAEEGFTKTEKEVLKKGDVPKVMDMEINLDDWFLDDIQKFTKRAIKSCLTLEEASFLGTNKMDKLILDICNKVFQELYREIKTPK